MKWMGEYAREVGLCKKGYKVVKREVSRGTTMLGQESGRIWYTAECK
jgi:hypothetical protein